MSTEQQIVLYGRFRVPASFGSEAMAAYDLLREAKVIAYASPLLRSKYQTDVAAARRIQQEMQQESAGEARGAGDVEIFTTSGWLWVIARGEEEAEGALRKLREAGLMAAASRTVTASVCPECGAAASASGQLCEACVGRKGGRAVAGSLTPGDDSRPGGLRRLWIGVLVVLALIGLLIFALRHGGAEVQSRGPGDGRAVIRSETSCREFR